MRDMLMASSHRADMSISSNYFDILSGSVDVADITWSICLSNGSSSTYHEKISLNQLYEQFEESKDLEEKIV